MLSGTVHSKQWRHPAHVKRRGTILCCRTCRHPQSLSRNGNHGCYSELQSLPLCHGPYSVLICRVPGRYDRTPVRTHPTCTCSQMTVRMFMCTQARVHVQTCTYAHTHSREDWSVSTHAWARTGAYRRACTHVRKHARMHLCMHEHTGTQTMTQARTHRKEPHRHPCTRTHVCMCVHARMHIHRQRADDGRPISSFMLTQPGDTLESSIAGGHRHGSGRPQAKQMSV